ncbi:beta-lactamase-like protein [Penicillium digitatum]|uniref:Metallo-beta-lactamase domain-containing protein n=3 Tax=Penicillium digitatum TaxID=36651 RepID=K9G4E1_PEND2|nr:hypothetical protein PDIP_23490 [Penicillium digitatum Pd1]EKV16249.1 hypothetical protein PDIG_21210 [Penicillium digitatum PHI26]EKV19422.1 hypothetical protein PDIP_23490 [Penicillium digitatum Pd1]KAG0153493.1 hypothetical protein PDIDSM_2145 [Penicillium digitatum]QQK47316.1 beta-lactamase-like protein [Penicillium digitatum]
MASSPALKIPPSSFTVDVRVIDTQTELYLNSSLFWQPPLEGFAGLNAPVYCFLITHGDTQVIFDLGVRSDWENYAPHIVSLIKATTTVTRGKDVAAILDAEASSSGIANVRSSDIRAVIWSHNHFDHIGNMATFQVATDLVVGPGLRAASIPGWPADPGSVVLTGDTEGRTVREISFASGLKIGRFDAVDYFGDGSFYLLDAPGHAVGHLCALARTTPDSFVLMGADACHHASLLRPTEYLPLPASVPVGIRGSCPGDVLAGLIVSRGVSPCSPLFTVAGGPVFHNRGEAVETVRKIQELDAEDGVFVILAHDRSLMTRIPMFPNKVNGWREMSLGSATRWMFCEDLKHVKF